MLRKRRLRAACRWRVSQKPRCTALPAAPGDGYLPDAMKQTGRSRDARFQPSQPRAEIPMPPLARRDVIVQRQNRATLRATEASVAAVSQYDNNRLGRRLETHAVAPARPLQRQQAHENC